MANDLIRATTLNNYANDLENLEIKAKLKTLADCPTKTLEDGSKWVRIFYHNCNSGNTLFTDAGEALNTTSENKFSRLYLLSFLKSTDGYYEFILDYPTGYPDLSKYNRWKQTNSPLKEYNPRSSTSTKATGYVAIHIDWDSNYWGGLEKQNNTTVSNSEANPCYLSGSVGHGDYFYAIGETTKYGNGIPAFTGYINSTDGSTANDVELWVRVDNVQFYTDGLFTRELQPLTPKVTILDNTHIVNLQKAINNIESLYSNNCCESWNPNTVCQSDTQCSQCSQCTNCSCQSSKCQSCQDCQSCQNRCNCDCSDGA